MHFLVRMPALRNWLTAASWSRNHRIHVPRTRPVSAVIKRGRAAAPAADQLSYLLPFFLEAPSAPRAGGTLIADNACRKDAAILRGRLTDLRVWALGNADKRALKGDRSALQQRHTQARESGSFRRFIRDRLVAAAAAAASS